MKPFEGKPVGVGLIVPVGVGGTPELAGMFVGGTTLVGGTVGVGMNVGGTVGPTGLGVAEGDGSLTQVELQKLSNTKFNLTFPLGKAAQTEAGELGHCL